jgi:hypothetical protein
VTDVRAQLSGRVLRLDPRRRVATVALPSVGQGRSFSADYANRVKGWPALWSGATGVAVELVVQELVTVTIGGRRR